MALSKRMMIRVCGGGVAEENTPEIEVSYLREVLGHVQSPLEMFGMSHV